MNEKLLNLIASFEGYASKAPGGKPVIAKTTDKVYPYKCAAGKWTIGYGATYNPYTKDSITETTEPIDNTTALDWLNKMVADVYYPQLEKCLGDKINILNQNQKDALTSIIYNCGSGNFSKSKLCDALLAGDLNKASILIASTCITAGGKINDGLINRRVKEQAIFNEKV
jgi:lysozyme